MRTNLITELNVLKQEEKNALYLQQEKMAGLIVLLGILSKGL